MPFIHILFYEGFSAGTLWARFNDKIELVGQI
jgi:hypothetical protein